jgi:hypothetical protein
MKNTALSHTIFHYNKDFNIFEIPSHTKNILFCGFLNDKEWHDPTAFLNEMKENKMKLIGFRFWWESIRDTVNNGNLNDRMSYVRRPLTINKTDDTSYTMYPISNMSNMQNIASQIDVYMGGDTDINKFTPFAINIDKPLFANDIKSIIVSPHDFEFGHVMTMWGSE